MVAHDTWGGHWKTSWGLSWTKATTTPITGGHFLPATHKHKRTLSNINVIYKQAQQLPRAETKELRDSIAEFVPPEVAMVAKVPDFAKIDYTALEANIAAYEKFAQALMNIYERMEIFEQNRVKQEQDDDDLLMVSIIASLMH